MTIKRKFLAALTLILGAAYTSSAHAQWYCNDAAGTRNGNEFYTWFELSSGNKNTCDTRLALYPNGRRFRATWDMEQSWGEDAVGGMGWQTGGDNRKIGYRVYNLETNSSIQKAIVAMYGWSCHQSGSTQYSQEYYIVDTWDGSGKFVPWDENANSGSGAPASSIGTVSANGATYDVYKVGRNGAQYCFNGANRSFDQFWSVRQSPASINKNRFIDFKPHADEWDDDGFKKAGVDNGYQILAAEIFGDANVEHKGYIDATVWWRGGN